MDVRHHRLQGEVADRAEFFGRQDRRHSQRVCGLVLRNLPLMLLVTTLLLFWLALSRAPTQLNSDKSIDGVRVVGTVRDDSARASVAQW